MSQELFYTSAPAGLKPGSKGFCTVAMTAGMSGILMQRLEMLSGYRELFPTGDERSEQNPIAWSHWRLSVAERTANLLSRVCSAGMDYTRRANTFAHHVVIDASEQSPGGPAWLMSQPGLMESTWDGSPRLLPRGRPIPIGEDAPGVCLAWEAATGDAGWAGVLAETVLSDASNVAYLIYLPGADVLSLIREAMALLPPRQRWLTTFCTYFTELPAGLTCSWRCCVAGTAAAKDAHRHASTGVIIDLTQQMNSAHNSPLVEAARTGESLLSAAAAVLPAAAPAMDFQNEQLENASPGIGNRQFRSQQTLNDLNSREQGWMPPVDPTVLERGDTHAVSSVVHSSGPRTRFWLIAILWPLLLIPGMIMWHLTSESQARRDLEARVTTLNAKIQSDADILSATKQAASDNLTALDRRDKERISKLSATTQSLSADLEESKRRLQNGKKQHDSSIASKDDDINNLTKQDQDDKANASRVMEKNTELREQIYHLDGDKTSLAQKNDYLNKLVAASTQPFFWAGTISSEDANVSVIAPTSDNYQCRIASTTKTDIYSTNGQLIASIFIKDGQLTFEPRDIAAAQTDQFTNWQKLASVEVFNGNHWTIFQFSLPTVIPELPKTWDLPSYVKTAGATHIVWRRAPQCDSNWQVEVDRNKIDCSFQGITITVAYKDGVLSRTELLPKNPPQHFPPLVLDLLYEYDAKPKEKLLCRVKITSLLDQQ